MMRGLSSALKKIVRGERKAGAHSRFSPGCRREAERTAAAGLQSFHRTSPDAHSAHRRISRTPEYRSPARRLICAMFGVLLLLSPAALTSCGSGGEKDGRLTVVCTNFPCYDFARQLCRGTDAEIVMLLPPGGESHSYDPTPKDIAAIARADVFVYVGGESDEWGKRRYRLCG